MNKKILIISMALFAIAMLVAPAMAKGPLNAVDKNPNASLDTTTSGTDVLDLNLPSGVTNRWFGTGVRVKVRPADKFYNPTTLDVGDNFIMWLTNPDYRGKWVKMNKGGLAPPSGYLGLFVIFGLTPPTDVPPEGVYIWGSRTS